MTDAIEREVLRTRAWLLSGVMDAGAEALPLGTPVEREHTPGMVARHGTEDGLVQSVADAVVTLAAFREGILPDAGHWGLLGADGNLWRGHCWNGLCDALTRLRAGDAERWFDASRDLWPGGVVHVG